MPVNPAGMRMDPPPSDPVAMGSSPPATAAAVPPDEPPGVCSSPQGLRVVPCRRVCVQFTPPNSLAVVCAGQDGTGGAQPVHHLARLVGDAVGEDQRGLGEGPSLHRLELLHTDGYAPEGERDVGALRAGAGPVVVQMREGVQLRPLDGGVGELQGLGRGDGPLPVGLDEEQASPCQG